jgi:hypothetical protein
MLYKQIKVHPYSPVWRGEQQPPKVANIGNINNMPNRRYLPSINFSVPFARWSDFYVSMAQNHQGGKFASPANKLQKLPFYCTSEH